MIIDFHVHCFPAELAQRAVPVLAREAKISARLDGTVEQIKNSMKKAGIDHSVVLSIATKPSHTERINNWSAEIQDEEITAFGSIHPDFDGWRDEFRRIKDLGLKGVKYHPDYQLFYVDEPRMFPVYELAFELGLVVVFHAGLDIGLSPPYHCDPQRLLKLARAFPGGRFVAAHLGSFQYWDDVERLLAGEDMYFDMAYTLGHARDEQVKRIIEKHGYEKILFATDSPWSDQAEEITRFKALNLGSEAENAILYGNAGRLLGLCK